MRTLPAGLFLYVFASLALVFNASAQTPGEIITYAGNGYGAPSSGGYSGDGGPATSAEFFSPIAVVADKSGNLFIADGNNFCVRKVTASTQIVSTVAGVCTVSGYSGDGGLATSAELSFPSALALDGTGNLYIADTSNYRIRKVAVSSGVITTVAGDGTQGNSGDGGLATSAQLGRPTGIAVDAAGNIYIADPYSNTVRKVTASTGIISLVAGGAGASYPAGDGGPASAAGLNGPGDIAVDGAGNLYIVDQNNAVVRKVTASTGIITTVAGNNTWGFSGDGGQATRAQLYDAGGIAVDSAGSLYIADTLNYRIRKVTAAGIISTIAGNGTPDFSGDGGPATTAALNVPLGVAVSASGNVFIADTENNRVREVFPGGLTASLTTLTVPSWPPLYGTIVELTAQVAGPLNGPTPTGTVTFYNGTESLGSADLNSSATATLFTDSLVAGTDWLTATYNGNAYYNPSSSDPTPLNVVTSAAAPPWFSVRPGTYESRLQVAINDSSPGVFIFFTTDGSTPSPTHGTPYSGAVTVNATETIRAMAVGPQFAMGPVSSASYVIHLPFERPLPRGEWAWEGGGNNVAAGALSQCGFGPGSLGLPGVYGTLGNAADTNVPGSRRRPVSWTDKRGNFWLFGGFGFDSTGHCAELNDLWEFNPSTLKWTWMGGSSAPPYFEAGVYGTRGKFAPENIPGSRDSGVGWTDKNGNLWLFGGVGFDSNGNYGYFNDLWEFDISTRQWAWVAGSNVLNQIGAYGLMHVPHTGNTPGGRWGAVSWTDRSGNLWLFGGDGYDATGANGVFNDLWVFNTSTMEWAWMGGSHIVNRGGKYGKLGLPSVNNIPGSREGNAVWVDKKGNFWLFGGFGFTQSDGPGGMMNDLWEFDPSTQEWTWVSGDNFLGTFVSQSGWGQAGVYGWLGVPDPGNNPGSRINSATWTDADGNLWLLGGGGFDSAGGEGAMNDLWEFALSTRLWAWMGGRETVPYGVPTDGIYGNFRVPSPANVPGGRTPAARWTDRQGNLWLFGGGGYDAVGNDDLLNDMWEYRAPSGRLRRQDDVFATQGVSDKSGNL
jgi:N-acetylneuraminic acid mutarotase